MTQARNDGWRQTACILCSLNCGIETQVGGADGRRIERIRGDKAHPASQGYTCEKPQRLDSYQNAADRLTSPLRRRPDGTVVTGDCPPPRRAAVAVFAAGATAMIPATRAGVSAA